MELLVIITFLFFGYFATSFAVGIVAGARGRDGTGWLFISLLFSPILALLFLACLPVKHKEGKIKIENPEPYYDEADFKDCTMCAEPVRLNARLCRYCGHSFETIPE